MSAKHRGHSVVNHELYPKEISADRYTLYNRDLFWKLWQPEDFLSDWRPNVSRIVKRSAFVKTEDDYDPEITFYRGCPMCGVKTCEIFFTQNFSGGGGDPSIGVHSYLGVAYQCEWGADWPKYEIEDADGFYTWEQIVKLASDAELSTPFENPFEHIAYHQFDNPPQKLEWLIEGILPANSIGSIFGPSGSYKSFVALHMAKAIASKVNFMGRKTTHGTVLYLAPDGGNHLGPRLKAWDKENDRYGWYTNFFLDFSSINLEDDEFIQRLIRCFNSDREWNHKLLVIDSFKQAIIGNDADETLIRSVNHNLKQIRDETGISILLVDHTGHNTGQRASGSYQKRASWDFEYFVKKEGMNVSLKDQKQRNTAAQPDFMMKAIPRYGSLILEACTPPLQPTKALLNLFEKSDEIATDHLKKSFICEYPDKPDTTVRRWFDKALVELTNLNQLEINGDLVRRTYS